MLGPDDLDRDELVELARLALASGAVRPPAIVDASRACVERLGAAWRRASDIATADCHAVRNRFGSHGSDDRYRALFAAARKSASEADRLYRVYDRAYRRYLRRKRALLLEAPRDGR